MQFEVEERHLEEEQLLGDSGEGHLEELHLEEGQLLGEAWRFHPSDLDRAQNHVLRDQHPLNKKKERKIHIQNQVANQEIHTIVLRPSQALISLLCSTPPSRPLCSFL